MKHNKYLTPRFLEDNDAICSSNTVFKPGIDSPSFKFFDQWVM